MLDEKAIHALLQQGASQRPPVPTPDGGFMLVIPPGFSAEYVAPLDRPLVRIGQKVTFHDMGSFVSYVNRYKTEATRIFAEPGFLAGGAAHVTAVFDYHAPPTKADHCAHAATYVPRYSDQWSFWKRTCVPDIKQAPFAELIEEARKDIVKPEAAQLLDIVRAFKAKKNVEFDSVVYQPGGDVKLAYSEQTNQQGSSGSLPETMELGIPVYFRGTVYAVPVFVRFRVGSGAVTFQLKLDRADVIEDAAFAEVMAAVSTETSIEVYLGRRS